MATPNRGYPTFAGTDNADVASKLNAISNAVDPDVAKLFNPPRALLQFNGSVGAPNANTTNPSTNWTTVFQANGAVGGSTGVTVPIAGDYRIEGSQLWSANGTGRRGVLLTLNGAQFSPARQIIIPATSDGTIGPSGSFVVRLAANDLIGMIHYQNSGAGLNLLTAFLSVTFVGVGS